MTQNLHVSHSDKLRPALRAAMLPAALAQRHLMQHLLSQESLEEQQPLVIYSTSKTQE